MTAETVTERKPVTSALGESDLDIPKDRKGEFEPQIVKKNQTDVCRMARTYRASTDMHQ